LRTALDAGCASLAEERSARQAAEASAQTVAKQHAKLLIAFERVEGEHLRVHEELVTASEESQSLSSALSFATDRAEELQVTLCERGAVATVVCYG
jgi:hypothetical protein